MKSQDKNAPPRIDVIFDVGKGSSFLSAKTSQTPDGRLFFTQCCGSGGPEIFGRKVGQLSEEEVIEVAREGVRQGWAFTPKMEKELRKSARKGPRRLKLR